MGGSRSLPGRAALLVGLVFAAALAAPIWADSPRRIVAVGDVHGSLEGLTAILGEAGLIDGEARWIGGDTTLVQLGDLLDRGADVRAVMDLMMRLQEEAPAAGGRVVCLLGNHETMNLLGIFRDVNPEAYSRFADERSQERREQAYESFVRYWKRRSWFFDQQPPTLDDATRERWMEAHPRGAVEYAEELGPEGRYGRWLRSCPVAVRFGDTLFVHGGLSPAIAGSSAGAINRQAAGELATSDRLRRYMIEHELALATFAVTDMAQVVEQLASADQARGGQRYRRHLEQLGELSQWRSWSIASRDGPLWFRGAAKWDEVSRGEEMTALLDGFGVHRMVVGHSVSGSNRIESRFEGRVYLIDTGMLAEVYEGGRSSALEITGQAVTAVYLDGRQTLVEPEPPWSVTWLGPDGERLPFQSTEEAVEFLRTAAVVSIAKIDRGVTEPCKVLLEWDGVRAHAVFKDVDLVLTRGAARHRGRVLVDYRDYHLFECAAYELDRLMGLDRVPPAVPRTVDGARGTLQLWMEETIMDVDRRDMGLEPPDPVRWHQQRQMMHLFDDLVGNSDANLGNLLIDRRWRMWFIDHTRSFVRSKKLRDPERISYCERGMWEALLELDEDEVRQRLDPYLTKYEVNALVARRQALIDHIQGMIDHLGEAAVLFELRPHEGELVEWPE